MSTPVSSTIPASTKTEHILDRNFAHTEPTKRETEILDMIFDQGSERLHKSFVPDEKGEIDSRRRYIVYDLSNAQNMAWLLLRNSVKTSGMSWIQSKHKNKQLMVPRDESLLTTDPTGKPLQDIRQQEELAQWSYTVMGMEGQSVEAILTLLRDPPDRTYPSDWHLHHLKKRVNDVPEIYEDLHDVFLERAQDIQSPMISLEMRQMDRNSRYKEHSRLLVERTKVVDEARWLLDNRFLLSTGNVPAHMFQLETNQYPAGLVSDLRKTILTALTGPASYDTARKYRLRTVDENLRAIEVYSKSLPDPPSEWDD